MQRYQIDGLETDGEARSLLCKDQAKQLSDQLKLLSSAMSHDSLVELELFDGRLSARIITDATSLNALHAGPKRLTQEEQEERLRKLWGVLREGLIKRGERPCSRATRR